MASDLRFPDLKNTKLFTDLQVTTFKIFYVIIYLRFGGSVGVNSVVVGVVGGVASGGNNSQPLSISKNWN